MTQYIPYSICTPDFNPLSGGIRVMWGLFGHLLARGQLAATNVRWHDRFTAIYPEITHGNPLGGHKVIRYILNKPGFIASYGVPGPTQFDPSDEIYVFSKIYDTFGVDDDHLLFLPILNMQVFKYQKRVRNKTAYFVGKGRNLRLHPEDAIQIDHRVSIDQQVLANTLNACHTFYTYENPTAMVEIARLCGCRVVFFPQGASTSYTQEQLTEDYEPGMDGVSFEKDEDKELDIPLFRAKYANLMDVFNKKLTRFIDHTQV